MDDATLRRRLWDGFARLQALLGGSARHGVVLESPALVASIVPHAPDSPALNAAVALDAAEALRALEELAGRYSQAGVRRWGVWLDGDERDARRALQKAGLSLATASPGMAATLDELDLRDDNARPSDLRTVALQATDVGERLYARLGFRRLGPMELWERRA